MELHGIICHSAQEQADGTGADDDADGGGQPLGDQFVNAFGRWRVSRSNGRQVLIQDGALVGARDNDLLRRRDDLGR